MIKVDPNCPRCHGTGIVQVDGQDAACACVRPARAPCSEDAARIPAKYRGRSFENFGCTTRDQARVLQAVREYVAAFMGPGRAVEVGEANGDDAGGAGLIAREKNGLLLYGDVGTGKTHLAVATLRLLLERGFDGLYWNVNDLFRAMRATFGEGRGGDEELLAELTSCDILVLDDLGTHRNTDFVLERLYLIINRRYDALLPIITTTNFKIEDLFGEFDSRIASRLLEMCYQVKFAGGDFRMAAIDKARRRQSG